MAHADDTKRASADHGTTHASLPADRAFVVQIRADADLAGGEIRGRVEHVTSGNAAVFDSVEQLVRSMRAAMTSESAAGRPTRER